MQKFLLKFGGTVFVGTAFVIAVFVGTGLLGTVNLLNIFEYLEDNQHQ